MPQCCDIAWEVKFRRHSQLKHGHRCVYTWHGLLSRDGVMVRGVENEENSLIVWFGLPRVVALERDRRKHGSRWEPCVKQALIVLESRAASELRLLADQAKYDRAVGFPCGVRSEPAQTTASRHASHRHSFQTWCRSMAGQRVPGFHVR